MPKKIRHRGWTHTKKKKDQKAKARVAPNTISRTEEEPPPALENDDLNAVTPESEYRRLAKLLYLKFGADWRKRQSTTDGADSINAQDLVEDGYVVDIGHVGINNQVIDTNQIYTIDAFEAKMEDDIDLGSSNEQVDQNVPLSIRKGIPLENEEIVVHITADSDTQMMERVDVTSDTSTDEVDQNVALSIREEIPPENEENVEHITTDHDAEMVESENEAIDSSTENENEAIDSSAESEESSENSLAICGLCRKSVVNKIICIKCETPFHAACFGRAGNKKSSSCQHVQIQDIAKNTFEQKESTEHLKLQVDLLKKLVKEMASKNEILLENNRLLSEKVEWVEKKNRSMEKKIETLQEKNRYLKKINKSLEKKVPLVSLSINK